MNKDAAIRTDEANIRVDRSGLRKSTRKGVFVGPYAVRGYLRVLIRARVR